MQLQPPLFDTASLPPVTPTLPAGTYTTIVRFEYQSNVPGLAQGPTTVCQFGRISLTDGVSLWAQSETECPVSCAGAPAVCLVLGIMRCMLCAGTMRMTMHARALQHVQC